MRSEERCGELARTYIFQKFQKSLRIESFVEEINLCLILSEVQKIEDFDYQLFKIDFHLFRKSDIPIIFQLLFWPFKDARRPPLVPSGFLSVFLSLRLTWLLFSFMATKPLKNSKELKAIYSSLSFASFPFYFFLLLSTVDSSLFYIPSSFYFRI